MAGQDTDKLKANTNEEILLKEALKRLDVLTVPGGPALVGFATEAKQDEQIVQLDQLVGFEIPKYDFIGLTYVAAGNGIGEIETVSYKQGGAGGTLVATLTLAYNASNEVISITKS
jgi:hypothetical protein